MNKIMDYNIKNHPKMASEMKEKELQRGKKNVATATNQIPRKRINYYPQVVTSIPVLKCRHCIDLFVNEKALKKHYLKDHKLTICRKCQGTYENKSKNPNQIQMQFCNECFLAKLYNVKIYPSSECEYCGYKDSPACIKIHKLISHKDKMTPSV